MPNNNLTVTGNLAIGGSSVFTGTVDLAGGALNTDLVTNFNADLLDSAHKDTDGTLSGNSDSSIPTEKAVKTYADARKAECVALTGNQTVAGVKTFSSIPVLPASNPTADNEATRKAYVNGLTAALPLLLAGNLLGAVAAAGNDVAEYADTEKVGLLATSYTKIKEIVCCLAGTVRVAFDAHEVVGYSGSKVRVYLNGVAAGIERTLDSSGSYVTFSEDFAVAAGDLVQLYYMKVSSAVSVRNFRVKTSVALAVPFKYLAQGALVTMD